MFSYNNCGHFDMFKCSLHRLDYHWVWFCLFSKLLITLHAFLYISNFLGIVDALSYVHLKRVKFVLVVKLQLNHLNLIQTPF